MPIRWTPTMWYESKLANNFFFIKLYIHWALLSCHLCLGIVPRDESGMDISCLSVRLKCSNSNRIYIRIPVRYSDSLIGYPISVTDNVPDTGYGYGMPSIRRISDIRSDIYSNTRVIIRGHTKTGSKIAYELYFGRSVYQW